MKRAQCFPNPNPDPTPSVCAEERSFKRIRARTCLSAASLCVTPLEASTAGCPQRSGGTQTPGSPFFSLGFFGEAKKSKSPAAATERHQDSAKNQVRNSTRGFDRPQPDPSIPQDERGKASTGSARSFDTLAYPVLSLSKGQDERGKASTGSARTGMGTEAGTGTQFGSGRFRGQSTNSPRLRLALRLALRVLRSEIVIRPRKPGSADISLRCATKL